MHAYLPYFSLRIFPNLIPKNVKDALVNEKIISVPKILFVIKFNPSPVEKLSILTEKENNNIPINDVNNFFSSFLKLDKIISIPINDNIIKIMYLPSIIILLITTFPIVKPSIGIKKWKIPTIIDNIIDFDFDKLNVP